MNNNNNRNNMTEEEMKKHNRTCKILRIVGIIMIVLGGALEISGTILLMNFVQWSMIFLFIGGPVLIFGIFLTTLGFRSKMARFTMNQTKDVNKDYVNYMLNNTKQSMTGVASNMFNKETLCPKCGASNDSDAKFCKKCGEPLQKVCPKCETVNDVDAEFCDNCGYKLK